MTPKLLLAYITICLILFTLAQYSHGNIHCSADRSTDDRNSSTHNTNQSRRVPTQTHQQPGGCSKNTRGDFNNKKPDHQSRRNAALSYADIARFVQNFEGFRASPYRDQAGKWTAGFGTLVGNSRNTYTLCNARSKFRRHIQSDYDHLARYTSRDTALVMCSFAYNCGLKPALAIVKSKRYKDMLRYTFVHQKAGKGHKKRIKELPGLVKRRKAEYALLQSLSKGLQ